MGYHSSGWVMPGNGSYTWQALQLWGQALHSPGGQGGHGPWGGVKGGSAPGPLGQLATLCPVLVPNSTHSCHMQMTWKRQSRAKTTVPMPCYVQEEGAGGGGGEGGIRVWQNCTHLGKLHM